MYTFLLKYISNYLLMSPLTYIAPYCFETHFFIAYCCPYIRSYIGHHNASSFVETLGKPGNVQSVCK